MPDVDRDRADETVVKEVFIDAPPSIVYGFITESPKWMRWMGTEVDLDPRPGGIFRLVPNTTNVILGEFVEAVPYEKVVFTWGYEGEGHAVPAGSTVVEITLKPDGAGTVLRLVHRNLTTLRDQHDFGWDHYVARLCIAASGRDPGPDPYADPSFQHG
ncbi:MAG: SRPBCC domain-containing protein [Candidatus Eremiobacteraeota bacterium]|nr:SRPBCC domain-containing protein [Candidatus Eremiobacteraeota bacterium]